MARVFRERGGDSPQHHRLHRAVASRPDQWLHSHLAAATFHKQVSRTDVAESIRPYAFAPLLGSALAPTLSGIAPLCCGLNSTVTATLSGQIVMEGFINIRVAPWLRRSLTRMIGGKAALAAAVTILYGEKRGSVAHPQPGGAEPVTVARHRAAGDVHGQPGGDGTVAPRWLSLVAAIIAAIVVALNEAAGRLRDGVRERAALLARRFSRARQSCGSPDAAVAASMRPAAWRHMPLRQEADLYSSCASPRSSSRDRRRAGPCGGARRYDRGSLRVLERAVVLAGLEEIQIDSSTGRR